MAVTAKKRKVVGDYWESLRAHWPLRCCKSRLVWCTAPDLDGDHGDCDCLFSAAGRPTLVIIRLADNRSVEQTIDTLIHEWAHAWRWQLHIDKDADHHDAIYGAIHSTMERHYG